MKVRKKVHDNWATPKELYNKLNEEFKFDFDPCPLNANFNGLEIEWEQSNFVNPPYNLQDKTSFVLKAIQQSKEGKLCVCLLPVSTSTKLFHDHILPNITEPIRFLKGRVKFVGINSQGKLVSNKCGMHDSMIIIFNGKKNNE